MWELGGFGAVFVRSTCSALVVERARLRTVKSKGRFTFLVRRAAYNENIWTNSALSWRWGKER
jgi:hypothetical protein